MSTTRNFRLSPPPSAITNTVSLQPVMGLFSQSDIRPSGQISAESPRPGADSDYAEENMDDEGLSSMEADIDLKNHVSGEGLELRQNKFKKTVSAIQTIVSKKLYKDKAVSLESYFKEVWKISRAQVYRFLDCSLVLAQLNGFTRIPTRERLCRTLKCLAKTQTDLRLLWASALAQLNGNPDAITSTLINSLWSDLSTSRKVLGMTADGQVIWPRGFDEDSWEAHVEANIAEIAAPWIIVSERSESIIAHGPAEVIGSPIAAEAPRAAVRNLSAPPPPPTITRSWKIFTPVIPRTPIISEVTSLLNSSESDETAFTSDDLNSVVRILSMIEAQDHHLEFFSNGEWKSASSLYWRLKKNISLDSQGIMLTTEPPRQRGAKSTIKGRKAKRARSKLNSDSIIQYEIATDGNETDCLIGPSRIVPVAAEPPRPQPMVALKRIRSTRNEKSESDSDHSSDYADLPLPRKRKQIKPLIKHQAEEPKNLLEEVSEKIIDDLVESCWNDFAPEEIEAVAFLQRYRLDMEKTPSSLQESNNIQESKNFNSSEQN